MGAKSSRTRIPASEKSREEPGDVSQESERSSAQPAGQALRGTDRGRVPYDPGPDHQTLRNRYGIDVQAGQARTLQRLETEFGEARVSCWVDQGMTIGTMGKPRDTVAFRERQEKRPEEVPTDIERRNESSLQRNTERNREKGLAGNAQVPDIVRKVVSSPGRSLDEPIQREMEEKMGDEFADVRIHTGARAAQAADSINARAFTVGNHIAFNRGEYVPENSEGQTLLAHELTHVRQQTEGAVSMLSRADSTLAIDPDPALEREADQIARQISSDPRTVGPLGTEMHVQPKMEVSSSSHPAEAERVAKWIMEIDGSSEQTHKREGQHTHVSGGRSIRSSADQQVQRQQDKGQSQNGETMEVLRKSPEDTLESIHNDIISELFTVYEAWDLALENFETQYDLGRGNVERPSVAETLTDDLIKNILTGAASVITGLTGAGIAVSIVSAGISTATSAGVEAVLKQSEFNEGDPTQVADFLTSMNRKISRSKRQMGKKMKEFYEVDLDTAFDEAMKPDPPREKGGNWVVTGEAARFFRSCRHIRDELEKNTPEPEPLSRVFQLRLAAGFSTTEGHTGLVSQDPIYPSGTLTIRTKVSASREEDSGRWLFEVDDVADHWTLRTLADNPGGLASAIEDALQGGARSDFAVTWFGELRREILIDVTMGDEEFEAKYVMSKGRRFGEGGPEFMDSDLYQYFDAIEYVGKQALVWEVAKVTSVEAA